MRAWFMFPLKKLGKADGSLGIGGDVIETMIDQEFPAELQRVVALLEGDGIRELRNRVRSDCLGPAQTKNHVVALEGHCGQTEVKGVGLPSVDVIGAAVIRVALGVLRGI